VAGGWNAREGIVVGGLDGEWFFQARHILAVVRRFAGRREIIAASGCRTCGGIVFAGLDDHSSFRLRCMPAAREFGGLGRVVAAGGCNARDGLVIAGLDGGGFFRPRHMVAVRRVGGLGEVVGVGRCGFGLGWSEGQSGLGLWLWALIGGLRVVGAGDPIGLWSVLSGASALCRCGGGLLRCGQHCWAPPWGA
jgi:hypothetical protein